MQSAGGVSDVNGNAEPPASIGTISPGKFDLREVLSVAKYISEISGNWQQGVDAFMNIARLCAEANGQLTTAQKSELTSCLPFGEATFSKFVQIGTDTRLKAPEVQTAAVAALHVDIRLFKESTESHAE